MRILHTSDWHLGRTQDGLSRDEDLVMVMQQIIDIAEDEQPDLILHTGDLFDHYRVKHDITSHAVEVLNALSTIAPVAVVAGNHDSSAHFETFHHLLRDRTSLRFVFRPAGLNNDWLEYPTPDGGTARVGALPFVPMHATTNVFKDPASRARDYAALIGEKQTLIGDNLAGGLNPHTDVAIYASHQYINGAGLSGSERHTNSYGLNAQTIPRVDYAAFGHIHNPQSLPNTSVCGWYAGSPIQLDFGEAGETKSVILVDAHPGKPTITRQIPLTAGRQLRHFTGNLEDLARKADEFGSDICRITITTDTFDASISDKVRKLLPRAAIVRNNQAAADHKLAAEALVPRDDTDPPGMAEAFADYLHTEGTHQAPAETVLGLMREYITAEAELRDPHFAAEADLDSSGTAVEGGQ